MSSSQWGFSTGKRVEGLRFLLLAAAIVTTLAIVAGTVVRVSGGAQGCPDWPTCFGQWGLPDDLTAQIQYVHRALTLISGCLTGLSLWFAVRNHREKLWILIPTGMALGLFLVETGLGAGRIFSAGSPGAINALHMGIALAILGLVTAAAVAAFFAQSSGEERGSAQKLVFRSPFARLTLALAATTFLVMVSGIYLAEIQAGAGCTGWPLCSGQILPASAIGWVDLTHRLLTLLASVLALAVLVRAWRSQRSQPVILPAATLTAVLFFGQVLVGALKVMRGYPVDLVGLHAAASAAVWAAEAILVAAVGLIGRSASEEQAEMHVPVDRRQHAKDMLALTKPVIVLLLLVTTYAGMVLGGHELPDLELTFWTLLAGGLAAGGSGAINQYIDRELDTHMQRTAKRPLAAGRLTAAEGLAFGLGILVLSYFLMAGFVNLLAALLCLAGMIYYILLYSIFLKKATVQNIVIGGGAGAIPPLVGWAAAAGNLGIPALFLFAIVFLWTPPHFWALALVRRKDYARAGVPMLPVVKGERATRTQIFIYTLELVGLTLLLPILHMAGSLYLVSAVMLGGALIYQAWRVFKKGGNKTAWMMYRYSSMYLALIFLALVLDVLV
ncbi:MAG TPA: heme o synthase [Anaerolineaceae bacterium]|nr:heme o synthase [Anaerolineaceae bacterium]